MASVRNNASSDEDEWSDNEFWNNAGHFDLLNDGEEDLRSVGDSDSSELGDGALDSDNEVDDDPDDLPLFYMAPRFQWQSESPADVDRRPFVKRAGPVRVVDSTATPKELFQLFYTDEVWAVT